MKTSMERIWSFPVCLFDYFSRQLSTYFWPTITHRDASKISLSQTAQEVFTNHVVTSDGSHVASFILVSPCGQWHLPVHHWLDTEEETRGHNRSPSSARFFAFESASVSLLFTFNNISEWFHSLSTVSVARPYPNLFLMDVLNRTPTHFCTRAIQSTLAHSPFNSLSLLFDVW